MIQLVYIGACSQKQLLTLI